MATSKREISQKVNSVGESEILIRISAGRGAQFRVKTGLFIKPARFKDGVIIKPRANQKEAAELREFDAELTDLEFFLVELCATTPKDRLTKDYLNEQVDRRRFPEKYNDELEKSKNTFFDVFAHFLSVRNLSDWRIRQYHVLIRALRRFESYKRVTGYRDYRITLDGFSVEDVNDFERFLRSEHKLFEEYPDIFKAYPSDTRKVRKKPKPLPKGNNTIVCTFSRLRAFFNWCNEQELTENKPFAKYSGVKAEKYGVPYYITIDERNHIAEYDMSATPALAVQRDIFIFHCMIGCRVSDLLRLTKSNIIDGAVEYIASKTRQERPEVIRVPLHPIAAALVEKYASDSRSSLFPFIAPQRYNDAIKKIFTICGITRSVTVINPTTGQEEQRPLNEIASSHIARRTFVGNLYKRVKDPNLVGKLSGHKEGSKAFTRYRDIDEEMKKEVINLLGE